MTKKLKANEKIVKLLKKAYKIAVEETCDFNCSACELDRKDSQKYIENFGGNNCPQVQLKWALPKIVGAEKIDKK